LGKGIIKKTSSERDEVFWERDMGRAWSRDTVRCMLFQKDSEQNMFKAKKKKKEERTPLEPSNAVTKKGVTRTHK